MIEKLNQIGIIIKGIRQNQKTQCPNCFSIGKDNFKDQCLSVDILQGLYNCHKCGWSGSVNKTDYKERYILPKKSNFSKLTNEAISFFNKRGITNEVIESNKIAMSKDGLSVIFPYLKNGELINFKQRFINTKDFRQAKDAEAIMYNYDRCKGQRELIVCEGEFDCMALEVAGFKNTTSVNQGAPTVNDKNIDKKLECITNCYELFEYAEKIFIATDNDENGRRLKDELIRRFGAEKCLVVDFNICKDANEFLLKYGVDKLRECVTNAKEVPIEGISKLDDVFDNMLDTFRNGKIRGTSTYWKDIDNAWTWRSREVSVWTGYQNEGKSLFLESLCILKSYFEGWRFAVFSPENTPVQDFYDNLIEIYIGKSADPYFKSTHSGEPA